MSSKNTFKRLLSNFSGQDLMSKLEYQNNLQLKYHVVHFLEGLSFLEEAPEIAIKCFIKANHADPDNGVYLHFYLRAIANIYEKEEFDEIVCKLSSSGTKLSAAEKSLTYYQPLTLEHENIPELVANYITRQIEIQEFQDILRQANLLIYLFPNSSFILNAIGAIEFNNCRYKTAENLFTRATELDPRDFDAVVNLAKLSVKLGNNTECIRLLKYAEKIHELPLELEILLAQQFEQLGDLNSSVNVLKYSCQKNPHSAEVLTILANLLMKLSDHIDAEKYYKKAIQLQPSNVAALNGLGVISHGYDDYVQAIDFFNKALSIDQNNHQVLNNLGLAYTSVGLIEPAIKSFDHAIKSAPRYASAHRNLSRVQKYRSPKDKHIAQINTILQDDNLSQQQRAELNFSLAKAYDDLGQIEIALNKFLLANDLRKKVLKYDASSDIQNFSNIKAITENTKNISIEKSIITDTFKMIFIVGMPRSGTTLLQQILSSHSKISSIGEVRYFEHAFSSIIGKNKIHTQDDMRRIRESYLQQVRSRRPETKFLIDKTPQNFMYVEFIQKVFPDAVIIHLHRNPGATCWSNFTQYFPSKSMSYTFNLDDIKTYYYQYHQLMNNQLKQNFNTIISCSYEKITRQTEPLVRHILHKLNLDFEEQCLHHEKLSSIVNTASNIQVRQPIFLDGNAKWLKYKPLLNDKLTNLPTFSDDLLSSGEF